MENENVKMNSKNFIDEVLKLEPQYSLPENFADVVTKKVSSKFALDSYFVEFLIYLGVIAGILLVFIIMSFIWLKADLKVWTEFFAANISWVTGINIILIFILFADRVLLRYFFYKMSLKSS